MSDSDRRVRWHDNGRGPRVAIDIGGESVVTTADRAQVLRDDLTAVLEEIAARSASPPHINADLATIGPLMTQAEAEQLRAERAGEQDDPAADRVRAAVREVIVGRGSKQFEGVFIAHRDIDAIADRVATQLASDRPHARIAELEVGLRAWRADVDAAYLDDGWIIIERIDALLASAPADPSKDMP